MTVRVDTQAAKERAEKVLAEQDAWSAYCESMYGPQNGPAKLTLLAEDVLALVGLLADAEKALERALRQRDEARQDEALAREQLGYWKRAWEEHRAAFDAAGGAGTE